MLCLVTGVSAASFLLLSPVPAGGGGGAPDLWISGAPGYLLSCHISLVSKLRGSGCPCGARVLNDSGHLSLTRSPHVSLAPSDLQEEGMGCRRRRKPARVNREVRRGSSERHTNFQFKKVCLGPSPSKASGESQP